MGWWIALGILVFLLVLPLGVSVHYNSQGAVVKIIAGPLKFTVVPGKKKPPKEKKEKPKKEPKPKKEAPKPPKQVGAEAPPPEPKPEEPKEKGGSLLDFLPLVKTVFEFLGDFIHTLHFDYLQLKLILAGGDPYDLALNYGRAWTALGNLLPKLEQWFVIKKRDIEVECDFVASETLVIAHVDLTVTLGRILGAVFKFLFKAAVQYLKIMKKRKGGAKNEPDVT